MKIYFDTEFIEDGKTIELLSIGMVREDTTTYYAEVEETDHSLASDWVKENVLPNLLGGDAVKPKAQIASEILTFAGDSPEFYAWYADYDWVALCQLYGRMIDLPTGWPMYARDFKQTADERGYSLAPAPSTHNALDDALWLGGEVSRFTEDETGLVVTDEGPEPEDG